MIHVDNDMNAPGIFSVYLKNPRITLFGSVYATHSTHFNGFQKNVKYNDNNEVNYVITNENGYMFRNVVIEFEFTEINRRDKICVYFANEEHKLNLLSIHVEDLLSLIKYKMPQVYNTIMTLHSKTGKMVLPLGNLIFEDRNIPVLTSYKFSILHISHHSIRNPSLKYEYYQLTKDESRRKCNLASLHINGYDIKKYKLIEETHNINFEKCVLPISSIMIKSHDKCLKSVQLQSNGIVHDIPDANEMANYNNFLNETTLDPEVAKTFYFLKFDTLNRFGYPGGKFIPSKDKNLIISGEKDIEITVILNFLTELRMSVSGNMIETERLRQDEVLPNYEIYDPLTIVGENKYIEGYWFCNSSPKLRLYPFPKSTDVKVNPEFLEKLGSVMSKCKSTYFLGSSHCRICHKENGNEEYTIRNNNVEFTFPSGIVHYYVDHNVHPSTKFYDFIMNYSDWNCSL